jgi:hypothetical protein
MGSAKVKQTDRIFKYMKDFGSISPKEAMDDLGVMRLAARISDLKDELKEAGIGIETKMETDKNRYGEPTHYARYYLKED